MSQHSQAPQDHRRKWDVEEFEQRVLDRIVQQEADDKKDSRKEEPVHREILKKRDYKVDLDSKLGKSQVITKTTPTAHQGGYFCEACDCIVKDSINYLDHINGRKHQQNMGMSMKVARSSLNDVKSRFSLNKRKMEEKAKDYNLEEKLKELKEEEEKQKAYRKEKKKESKKRKFQPSDDVEDSNNEMNSLMGFSGFSSKNK